MDSETIGLIVVCVILLLVEGMFCSFLAMIQSLSSVDIEKNEQTLGERLTRKLRNIIENKNAYENRALIAIVVTSVIAGGVCLPKTFTWCCEYIVTNFLQFPIFLQSMPEALLCGIFFVAVVFVGFILFLTFGVLIPRRMVRYMKMKTMAVFASVVMAVSVILKPLTNLTNLLAKGILRLFGVKIRAEKADVTEEEIISMVNEGQELGVLEAEEAEMITNIFEYGEKQAKDIMTNRNNITAIDGSMKLPEAIEFMLTEKNSRYPVYEENLDHIIGILHFKDAIRFHNANKRMQVKVAECPMLIREAVFVPETKNIDDLFQDMQSKKLQMVIVSDEYGQTSGLVAMEDILEEIVGNILDEYDEEEEYIEEKGDNTYEIDGLTPLEELEEELGITFENDFFDTLNGFLIYKLEHIPADGEVFELDYEGYHFKTLETENKMFKTVSVVQNVTKTDTLTETDNEESATKSVEESNK